MKQRESIYIIGEGETEKYYFEHLKKIKSYNCIVRPRLFSNNTSIFYLEKKTNEFIAADVTVICVFDADVAERNEKEKKKFKNFIGKYKDNKKVIICDSLPSIEFWFLLHFKKTSKYFSHYKQLRDELIKYIPNYDKNKKYLEWDNWVRMLVSEQDTAIKNAKSLNSSEVSLNPSQSYSNVYKAIECLEKTKRPLPSLTCS